VFVPLAHPPGHAQVDFGDASASSAGHVSAFSFFGGVPISILYDNLKIAVARILGDGKRQRTRAFTELVSHYLFQDRFGRPGKVNDKGKVETLVKYSRANFLTPVPHAASFEALNAMLEERRRARRAERAGRHEQKPSRKRRYEPVQRSRHQGLPSIRSARGSWLGLSWPLQLEASSAWWAASIFAAQPDRL
jgi:hypothetical protein